MKVSLNTHSCTDWSREYGDGWEAKFRQRYEKEMIEAKDTHFYVGTIHQHPKEWIIVGLFYPMKEKTKPMPYSIQRRQSNTLSRLGMPV